MSEVIKEQTWTFPTTTGEILSVNGCFDTVHRWSNLGFNILRYVTEEGETLHIGLSNLHADMIAGSAKLPICDRDSFFEREYKLYLTFASSRLDETYFGEFDDTDGIQ